MNRNFKVVNLVGLIMAVALFMLSGCGPTMKSLPPEALTGQKPLTVDMQKVPEEPTLATSGDQGLIALIVNSSRSSEMEDKVKGISGSALKELVQQNIANKLEDYFEIVDKDEKPLYLAKVTIRQWGWFLPTGLFGIQTGVYNFSINGEVEVEDTQPKKKEEAQVGYIISHARIPMGNAPTAQQIKQAMVEAAEKFAEQVVKFLVTPSKKSGS